MATAGTADDGCLGGRQRQTTGSGPALVRWTAHAHELAHCVGGVDLGTAGRGSQGAASPGRQSITPRVNVGRMTVGCPHRLELCCRRRRRPKLRSKARTRRWGQSREAHHWTVALCSPKGHASMRSDRTQRARREVEWASVRDCYDNPHRRSLTGGTHSSSRLVPASLQCPYPVVPVTNLTVRVRVHPKSVGPSPWRL